MFIQFARNKTKNRQVIIYELQSNSKIGVLSNFPNDAEGRIKDQRVEQNFLENYFMQSKCVSKSHVGLCVH